jgi:hypothetical protein
MPVNLPEIIGNSPFWNRIRKEARLVSFEEARQIVAMNAAHVTTKEQLRSIRIPGYAAVVI